MVLTRTSTGMRCECRPLRDAIDPQTRQAWQALLERVPHTPIFAHPEWVDLALHCGVVGQAAVLLVSHDDLPVAVIPIRQVIPRVWETLEPFSMTGATMIIDPSQADAVWASVGNWLRAHGAGVLAMNVSETHASALNPAAFATAQLTVAYAPTPPGHRVPLAESWEAFVEGHGRSTRRKLRTLDARLREGEPGVSTEFIDDEMGVDAVIDTLVCLYRRRWADQVGGSLLCPSCNETFLHQAMRWAVRHGYGVIPVIRYHGCPVAIGTVLALPGHTTAHYHFTVRDTRCDMPTLVHSPGTALAVMIVQWAIARGYATLDMGRGNSAYKQLLGGQPYQHWRTMLASSPLAAAALTGMASAAHLLQRLPAHLQYRLRRRATCACADDAPNEA